MNFLGNSGLEKLITLIKNKFNDYVPKTGGTFNNPSGTASTQGNTILTLGNNTELSTTTNSRGILRLFGARTSGTNFYGQIRAGGLSANRTYTLPNVGGTFPINQKVWTTVEKTTNFKGSWRYRKDETYFDACFFGENSVKTTSAFGSMFYGTIKVDLPETMSVVNCVATVMNNGGAGCFIQLQSSSTSQLSFYVVNAVSGTFTLSVSIRCLAT